MLSWRGGLNLTVGCNAFLIATLLDNIIVVWGTSPESLFHQQPVEIDKCPHRNVRGADLHRRTSRQVKHPCRHDDRSARFSFDNGNLNPGALLTIKAPHPTPVEGVPAVMDLNFLPDMGRITLRLLSGAGHGYSPAAIVVASAQQRCTPLSSRPN